MTWLARARIGAWVTVVAVGSWGIYSVRVQTAELDETRADVLCPLYGIFLQADTPERRAAMSGAELEQYEHAIAVLHRGADILGCPT